jgi:hypothetical protein
MTLRPFAKLSAVLFAAAAAPWAVAQTTYSTTDGTTTTVVTPAYGAPVVEMSTTAPPAGYGHEPSAATVDRTIANLRGACAGLSDRQTERACKEDQHRGTFGYNPSERGNDAGNSDDQAD